MDTVTVLRDLWRHRILVAGVAVLAMLVGVAVLYKVPTLESRGYQVGVATARILVDTPSSQVVEIAPKGSESLGVRANLLASLMVDGEVKTAIAEEAGLKPDQLVGISTSAGDLPVAAPQDRRASVLTTRVVTDNDGAQLPIIEVEAQAVDAAAAAKLASAAVEGLRDYLDSKAATQRVPDAQRLQVSGLGVPQAETALRGPRAVFALFAAILVFGIGAACILGFFAVVRAWRTASAQQTSSYVLFPEDAWDDADADAGATDGDGEAWSPPGPSLVAARADDEPRAKSA
jgi:hypothetical protein